MKLRTFLLFVITTLLLTSCGESKFEVDIYSDEQRFVTDTLDWGNGDTTFLESRLDCYSIYISKEYEDETFKESSYVLGIEEITPTACKMKEKINKNIEDYKKMRKLEEELSKKDC